MDSDAVAAVARKNDGLLTQKSTDLKNMLLAFHNVNKVNKKLSK